jgi:Skp family chaperone for outer membrane proteins
VKRIVFVTLIPVAAAVLSGCGLLPQQQSPIATVDIDRVSRNWPKFINYSNQLAADTQAIQRSSAPLRDKQRQLDELRRRYIAMQREVTNDVSSAAEQVATQRHFKLVVTRELVGYGGTDITPDVERILKITEVSPPATK